MADKSPKFLGAPYLCNEWHKKKKAFCVKDHILRQSATNTKEKWWEIQERCRLTHNSHWFRTASGWLIIKLGWSEQPFYKPKRRIHVVKTYTDTILTFCAFEVIVFFLITISLVTFIFRRTKRNSVFSKLQNNTKVYWNEMFHAVFRAQIPILLLNRHPPAHNPIIHTESI